MKKQRSNGEYSYWQALKINWRGFLILWKHDPQNFLSAAVCAAVGRLTPYVEIYLSAQLLNELAGERSRERIQSLVLWILFSGALLGLLRAVLERWKNYSRASWLMHYKRRHIYTEKMLDMDFASLDEPKTHELLSKIHQYNQWSGWGLQRVIWLYDALFSDVFNVLGACALAVSAFTLRVPESSGRWTVLNHPAFAAGIFLLILLLMLLNSLTANRASLYWTKRGELATFGNRCFSFYGFLAFHRPRRLDIRMYRQERICRSYLAKDMSFGVNSVIARNARGAMGGLYVLSSVFGSVFTGLLYLFICLKAWAGAFGVGSVTQYVGAISSLFWGASGLYRTMGSMRANAAYLEKTMEFLDIPNDMYQGSLTTEKRADRRYEVEFRDVTFRYPGAKTDALSHVSLKFRIGERLAVVGPNGSGKTTFIKLLCRLYDPTEGVILLNGIDIRKYRYDEYLDIFSVVFQDFQLLAFSLGQNVAASYTYDAKRAEQCLRLAGFGDRLEQMPQGLETYLYKNVSDSGVEVSGGEAQKIALARALYKDAPFIILDEPTAALDPIAEQEIYEKFNDIVEDRTAIYISHRLSSCRFCDRIAVFEGGGIVQFGTHEELLEDESGKYHELWHAQAQYYAKG